MVIVKNFKPTDKKAGTKEPITFVLSELGPFRPEFLQQNRRISHIPSTDVWHRLSFAQAQDLVAKNGNIYIATSSTPQSTTSITDGNTLKVATSADVQTEMTNVSAVVTAKRQELSSLTILSNSMTKALTSFLSAPQGITLEEIRYASKGEVIDIVTIDGSKNAIKIGNPSFLFMALTQKYGKGLKAVGGDSIEVESLAPFIGPNGPYSVVSLIFVGSTNKTVPLKDPIFSTFPRKVLFFKILEAIPASGNSKPRLRLGPTDFSPIQPVQESDNAPTNTALFNPEFTYLFTLKELFQINQAVSTTFAIVPGYPLLWDKKVDPSIPTLEEYSVLLAAEVPKTNLFAPSKGTVQATLSTKSFSIREAFDGSKTSVSFSRPGQTPITGEGFFNIIDNATGQLIVYGSAYSRSFTFAKPVGLVAASVVLSKTGTPVGGYFVEIIRDIDGSPSSQPNDILFSYAAENASLPDIRTEITIPLSTDLVAGKYHLVIRVDDSYIASIPEADAPTGSEAPGKVQLHGLVSTAVETRIFVEAWIPPYQIDSVDGPTSFSMSSSMSGFEKTELEVTSDIDNRFVGNLDRASLRVVLYDDDNSVILVDQGEAQPGFAINYKLHAQANSQLGIEGGDVEVAVRLASFPARLPIVGQAIQGALGVQLGIQLRATPAESPPIKSTQDLIAAANSDQKEDKDRQEYFFNLEITSSKGKVTSANKYGTIRVFDQIEFKTPDGKTTLYKTSIIRVDTENNIIFFTEPLRQTLPPKTIVEIPQSPLTSGRRYRVIISASDRVAAAQNGETVVVPTS